MPETTIYEVPYCRIYRTFNGGNNVDIVGVTGSIPVTPTIQSLDIAGLSGNRRPFCVVLDRFMKPALPPLLGVILRTLAPFKFPLNSLPDEGGHPVRAYQGDDALARLVRQADACQRGFRIFVQRWSAHPASNNRRRKVSQNLTPIKITVNAY